MHAANQDNRGGSKGVAEGANETQCRNIVSQRQWRSAHP